MTSLRDGGLNILILSPQPWDGLQVSKHHYARELAALGNRVWFINPPGGARQIAVRSSDDPAIRIVDHPAMPLARFKFRWRGLFDRAARGRARALVAVTGLIDLLWDFDNARQFASHRPFGARRSILHPVDRLGDGDTSHRDADLILGIDATILADIRPAERPVHVIGHGLSPLFARAAQDTGKPRRSPDATDPITVGFIGNLAQPAMDRPLLADMVARFGDVRFKLIGPVQGASPEIERWVADLGARPNVELAGLLTDEALIAATRDVDIWLLPYDRTRDRNRGVNSHKLLEYCALGGEIVTSWITAHRDTPGIFMAAEGDRDGLLVQMEWALAAVRAGRDTGTDARRALALANSYRGNVDRIDRILQDLDR